MGCGLREPDPRCAVLAGLNCSHVLRRLWQLQQQPLQRIQGFIRLRKIGKQGFVARRGGLAVPVGAKLLKDVGKASFAVDQPQDLRAVFAGVDLELHARVLVLQLKRLTARAAKHLGSHFACQGLVIEKRNRCRVAIRSDTAA